MSHGKVVIIEGTSNAGKSSLCKLLESRHKFHVIPEAIRYLENQMGKSGTEIMSIPKNINEEYANQELLFSVELQKLKDANLFSQNGINVVMDKSAYAIMATAYAFEKEKGFLGARTNATRLFREYLKQAKQCKLKMPDYFVLLTVDYTEGLVRNKTRGHVLDEDWIKENIFKRQERFLKIISCFSSLPSIKIDSSSKSTIDIMEEFLSKTI